MEKIGIISDTHGILRPQVKEILKDCDYILHAGDVTSDELLDQIRFLCKELYVVRGNCDSGKWAQALSEKLRFEISGVSFLMMHQLRGKASEMADVDVVICGHTHHYSCAKLGKTLYLNPGSCGFPRYSNSEVTMALMNVADGKVCGVQKVEF